VVGVVLLFQIYKRRQVRQIVDVVRDNFSFTFINGYFRQKV